MTRDEIDAWAAAFIEAQSAPHLDGDHQLWWAVEQFMFVVGSKVSPQDCWLAILEILSRNPADEVLAVLAAGPLEDLIAKHGPDFVERIETESRQNPKFRHLLGGVWQNSTSAEIWTRIKKAQGAVW